MSNVYKYKKGMLYVSDGYLSEEEENDGHERRKRNLAMLPHSCDAWQIGGKKEVRALIEDLQDYLDDRYEGGNDD